MDNLILKHLVQKKIDETGNIHHWFWIKDRPTKKINVFIGFKFSDGRDGQIIMVPFPKMTYKQRNFNKKTEEKTFGVFEVIVPNGKDPDGIFFYYERFLGNKSDVIEIEVNESFQDIVAEEAIYSAIFNKHL